MSDTPEMVPTRINDRWTLDLPKHRAERPGWAWWERDALQALWCCVCPGDVVWDIGAEEGDLSTLYASWGAQVCPVESSARSWPWIRATFEANGYEPLVALHALVGATNAPGPDETWDGRWPSAARGGYVPEAGFTHLSEAPDDLSIFQLDAIFPQNPPDVIVMDIEGAECQALLGAERLLREARPVIAVSVHPEFMRDRYRDTPDDLLVLLEKADYEVRYLGFTHEYHYFARPRS